VGLPDLSADDYLELDNPLASGLSALMRVSRLGKAVQKVWSLRKAAQSQVDEARKFLLVNLIETYLKLNKTEEAEFQHLVAQPDAEEVREMISVYEERGIQKGKHDMLLKTLHHKFGKVSKRVVSKVTAMQTEEELDALLNRILDARTLEETGLTTD
jgi:hypothetical protein